MDNYCVECRKPSESILCATCKKLISPVSQDEIDSFESRLRMTREQATKLLVNSNSNMIAHLLDNQDGTYSLVYHIVCEYCDYCESQGDCRGRPDAPPKPAKVRIYEETAPYYYILPPDLRGDKE